ncbi:MAG: hypothetical protein ABEJ92_02500 [Halobacteriales archaeon]
MSENYFDHDEEDVLHDAFLMIVCERTDYENIEDVLVGETIYDERTLDYWKQNADLLE